MDTEARKRILDEALTWEGTPFHHKGRVKGVGVDCGGFIYSVYSQFFQLKPFPEHYPEDWALHQENEIYLDFIQEYVKPVAYPQPAGISVWRFGRNFSHGSIYIGGRKYIHAWGRTQFGGVRISPDLFFRFHPMIDKMRPVKHFDLR